MLSKIRSLATAMAVAALIFTLDVSVGTFAPSGSGYYSSFGVAEAAKRSSSRSSSRSSWGSKKSKSKGSSSKKKKKKPQKSSQSTKKKPSAVAKAPSKSSKPKAKKPPKPSLVKKPKQGTFAKASDKTRSQKALKDRKAKAQKVRKSNPVASKATSGGKTYSHTTIRSTRTTYYSRNSSRYSERSRGYGDRYGNRYADRDYGGFDPTFLMLTMMSDDPGSTAMWYAMTGSPMMAIMMSDFRKEATTSGDSEVLARLDAVEADNARMKASGVVAQPVETVLAEMGVPAEVALSEEVLTGEALPVMRFGTGGTGGNYYPYCLALKQTLNGVVDVQCLTSAGSQENIQNYCTGRIDAMSAQSDTMGQNASKCAFGIYQKVMYPEFVYLISNRKAKADSIKDFAKGSRIYSGPDGSGTSKAWIGIVSQDAKRYGKKRFAPISMDYMKAAEIVANDEDAALLYVGALGSKQVMEIDHAYGDKLRLTAIDDWDFNDAEDAEGNPIYEFYDMPKRTFPNLQKGLGEFETMAVTAVFTLSESWANKYGEEVAANVIAALNWIDQ